MRTSTHPGISPGFRPTYFICRESVSTLLARDLSHGDGVVKGARKSPPSAILGTALLLLFFCNTTRTHFNRGVFVFDICVRTYMYLTSTLRIHYICVHTYNRT